MDDRGERPNRQDSVGEKAQRRLILQMLHKYRDEILATEQFTPQEALRLGGLYLTYRHDWLLTTQGDSLDPIFATPKYNRQQQEAALGNALRGNLVPLKEVLRNIGNTELKPTKGELAEQRERREKFGRKLLQLANAIPDGGLSFTPPPPIPR